MSTQAASLRAQLLPSKYNLEQTVQFVPQQILLGVTADFNSSGTYAAALPLRPVMVFIPEQKRRKIVAQFRQNFAVAPKTVR